MCVQVSLKQTADRRWRRNSSRKPTPPPRRAARAAWPALSSKTWPSPWPNCRAAPQRTPPTKLEVAKPHGKKELISRENTVKEWRRDPEEDGLQRRGNRGREGGKEGRFRRRKAAWSMGSITTCHQTLCRTRRGATPELTTRSPSRPAFTPSRTRN